MVNRPEVNTQLSSPETTRSVSRPVQSRAAVYSVGGSRAASLVQALSSVAPSLNQYIEEIEVQYRQDEENRAYDQIQGMTFDEAQKLVKSGQMRNTESPWYQAAFEKQFGMVYAGRRKRELVDAYNNSFDKHNGNIDEFVASFASSDLDKFGGSEFIMSGYREGMKGVLPTLRDQHAEWKSGWTRERVTENFGSIVYDAVGSVVEDGGDLNQVLGLLKGDHRESFGMTFKEMDAHIFDVAGRYAAEGNVEAAQAILSTDMVGPDGTAVGSYLSRPQYAEKAAQLLESAKATAGKAAREENTSTIVSVQSAASAGNLDRELAAQLRDQKQITQAEYEGLLASNERVIQSRTAAARNEQQIDQIKTSALRAVTSGMGYAIQDFTYVDATGKTRTVTRKDLVEGAVIDSMNELANRQTPPSVMAETLAGYNVDVTYPVWENLLSNGYLSLTENLSEGQGGDVKVPETSLKAFATWKALAETPNLRSRHVNNADAERVWSAAALLEANGYETEEALLRAASPPSEAAQAAANNLTREQIREIAGVGDDGGLIFGEDASNGAMAAGQIEAMTKFYVSRNTPVKQAVEQAKKDFEASHTKINGAYVNTRNVYLPPNFEDASGLVLQDFAETYGEDVEDLTLVPAHDGSNNWIVAYKGNVAMPVPTGGDGGNRIHVSQIETLYRQTSESVAETIQEEVTKAINSRQERRNPRMTFDGTLPRDDQMDAESIYDFLEQNNR